MLTVPRRRFGRFQLSLAPNTLVRKARARMPPCRPPSITIRATLRVFALAYMPNGLNGALPHEDFFNIDIC
jgi:hypothetical protein